MPTPAHPLAAGVSRIAHTLMRTEHGCVAELSLRLLALVYLAAFASFASQALGLIGSGGILPLVDYVEALRTQIGPRAYYDVPFVFWLSASDRTLQAVCALGIVAALVLLAGRLPRLALSALYASYLSLFYAGQTFMTFQWDLLLLETGVLALFLPRHPTLGVWLLRLLVFRFMLLSGAVKLLSGDPTWANLSALSFHYETQPLPTALAWYAHQLPASFHRACAATTFVIELVVPFCIFGPRRARFVAGVSFVLLEVLIVLTGNYNFFNLLTILLCLSLLDDRALAACLPASVYARLARRREPAAPAAPRIAALIAALLLGIGLAQIVGTLRGRLQGPAAMLLEAVAPLRLVNGYGLFAVMTTQRLEIVVEGSDDAKTWLAYEFAYKPGDLHRAPGWMIPHQPRLDWQMWFAALSTYDRNPWFGNFLVRLLEGAPAVTALLAHDPFAGRPPRYVHAVVYQYRFSDPATRAATGQWWTREPRGLYVPALRLRPLDADRAASPH